MNVLGGRNGKKAGLKASLINNINNRNFGKIENFGFWKILDFWKNWKKYCCYYYHYYHYYYYYYYYYHRYYYYYYYHYYYYYYYHHHYYLLLLMIIPIIRLAGQQCEFAREKKDGENKNKEIGSLTLHLQDRLKINKIMSNLNAHYKQNNIHVL